MENITKTTASILVAIAVIVLLLPLVLAVAAYVGWFYGIILSWLAGGILADTFGIERSVIPGIIAWIFVSAMILRTWITAKRGE